MAVSRRAFRDAALAQRVCAVTGQRGGWHAHHVVKEQHALRLGGNPHDPRNALRLAFAPHLNHHGIYPIELANLTDDNIAFAYELMPDLAYDYLHRYYQGDDPRVVAPA